MKVVTKAVSLVLLPLALVDVTIFVKQATEIVGLIILPVALIQTTIRPNLDAFSLTNLGAFTPLSHVARTIIEAYHGTAFEVLEAHLKLLFLTQIDEGAITTQHLLYDVRWSFIRK